LRPPGALFAVAAFLEGFTWAGLLIGMWLKYGPVGNELGVKIFGPLHGGAFLFYVVVTVLYRAAAALARGGPRCWR
jgi:hypothetical protein